MRIRLLIVLLLLTRAVGGVAQGADTATLELFFDRLLDKNEGMGGLTVARDGHVLYSRSFGYRLIDGARQLPLTAETRYRIGSITKTYTAVMVFQLVEEGRLKLTDTLDTFFPQVPNASRITIAQILHHRSGLPDLEADGEWGRSRRTREQILARIAAGAPDFEPDSMHRYSNVGYLLLGFVIEDLDHKPYRDALRDRITTKLGLADTYAGTGNTDPARNESLSYRYVGGWREAEEPVFEAVGGAGAIVATTADMAAFIKGVFDLRLISRESLTLMTTMRDGEGMGFEPHSFAGRTCFGHTGGSATSGAWLTYCPEEKLALAYATNAKVYPVRDIVTGVLDIVWDRPFAVPTFEAVVVGAEILDRYVGVYTVSGTPARMTIAREGGTLFIQPASGGRTPLEATADNTFQITTGVIVVFDASNGQMILRRPQGELVFTREP